MKTVYLFGVVFLIIDLLLGFYIFDKGGTDAAIKSGLMGNLSVYYFYDCWSVCAGTYLVTCRKEKIAINTTRK
jgi:hypothetical protein